ncbi:MAG TPA: carboxypeptidase-like regulatory domain-containing protein [Kofleriaceae bacterium]|nr:carboxypeptidase-like regulatory domain-containing protein [Kofleriaceae bacterium]
MSRALAWLVVVAACGGSTHAPLARAGDAYDDGGGELARSSMRLTLGGDDRAAAPEAARARGGYGGDAYGGAGYAGWTMPSWNYAAPSRVPHYNVASGLSGSIEGVVTWSGAAPPKLATACGTIDNPSLHLGPDRAVRDAIVYIERVSVGRPPAAFGRPAAVGGVVAKHGCALVPAAQIVEPLPAAVAIHGDAQRTRLRVGGKAHELEEAGMVSVEIAAGANEIDGDDGKLAAAWVLGLETPYFAITDDAGRFRIDQLAAGSYDVTFWQAPIATAGANGTIVYGAPIVAHRTVRIEAGKPSKLNVALP